jgi:radical SAM protein with 4Fe4S-binding SPASM domain
MFLDSGLTGDGINRLLREMSTMQILPGCNTVGDDTSDVTVPKMTNPLPKCSAPSFLALVLTHHCNLNCDYCSARAEHDGKVAFIPLGTLMEAVTPVIQMVRDKPLEVHLTGGEPLLAGLEYIKDLSLALRTVASEACRPLTIGLQTNGVLIDSRWAELFQDFDIKVSISMDGPPSLNDLTRGCSDSVIKGWHLLSQAGVDPGIIGCLDSRSVERLAEVVDYFESQRVRKLRLNPLLTIGRGKDNQSKLSAKALGQAWVWLLDHMLESPCRLREYNILRQVVRFVSAMQGKDFVSDYCEAITCHAGGRLAALLPNGSWAGCPRLQLDAPLPGQGPHDPHWHQAARNRYAPAHGWEQCWDCPADIICTHGCHAMHRGDFHNFDVECQATRHLFSALNARWATQQSQLETLASEGFEANR